MKIIVVGNAASLLNQKNGELIDSYDVVVSTQLALKFLNDALTLLKGEE